MAPPVPCRIRVASRLPEKPVSARLEAKTVRIAACAEAASTSANPGEVRVGEEALASASIPGLEDRLRLHAGARLARAQKPAVPGGDEGEGSARRSDARSSDALPGTAAVGCPHYRPHINVAGARADREPDVLRSERGVDKVLRAALPRAAAVVAMQQPGGARRG